MFITRMLSKREFLPLGLRALLKARDKRASDLRDLRCSDVLIVSYPKSGRTWLHVMISRLFTLKYHMDVNVLIEGSNLHNHHPDIPRLCISHMRGIDPSTDMGFQHAANDKKIILLVRNPIDVAVSSFYQATERINPKKLQIKQHMGHTPPDIACLNLRDFVMSEKWGVPDVVGYMNRWLAFLSSRPTCMVVRYEDLVNDTHGTMSNVVSFLQVNLPEGILNQVIAMSNLNALREQEKKGVFRNASMRPRNPLNPNSYKVRSGKIGGHKEVLPSADVEVLQGMIDAKLDRRFGYSRS